MSIQVVRVEGYNKGSLGTIGRECDRTTGVKHRNQEIEPSLSYLNYSYKDASQGFVSEFSDIKTALNVQYKETKKGVAFEGMIITADLPFFERLGYERGKPMPKAVKAFFDRSYAFAKAQIGYQGSDKNILSAKIHLDEKTPHLHLYYVPITEKWQSKVYAKDENGKVLRSERGTPIQAKGADGKTIYEQHEDKTAPKLSRTEFWRVRGGQSSYRIMQDLFQEMVGKEYGLERGEVGSDRKHKETAVYKQEQLTEEKERLIAEVEPLRELKTNIDEVDVQGKAVLPGIVAVKKKDLDKIKEQAKAYTVNRDEIDNLRQLTQDVKARESLTNQRECCLDNRADEIAHQEAEVQAAYVRQQNLNQILEQSEEECDFYKSKSVALERDNALLGKHYEQVLYSLQAVCKAVGMLKYGNDETLKPKLTHKQSKLITAIGNYGSKIARIVGEKEVADEIDNYVGISKGIAEELGDIEPKQETTTNEWDMEL